MALNRFQRHEDSGPVKQMWPGGPLRQFSETKFRHWMHVSGGYANSYVCADCKEPVVGVYKVDDVYVCSGCKDKRRPNPVK